MRSYYITFRSVTFAQRGERLLKNGGISCILQRASRAMEERGCGYSLVLSPGEIHGALELLRDHQVPYKKVYTKDRTGQLEEVIL